MLRSSVTSTRATPHDGGRSVMVTASVAQCRKTPQCSVRWVRISYTSSSTSRIRGAKSTPPAVLPIESSVLAEDLRRRDDRPNDRRSTELCARQCDGAMQSWRREVGDLGRLRTRRRLEEPPRPSRFLRALFDQGDYRAAPGLLDDLRNAGEVAVRHRVKEDGQR